MATAGQALPQRRPDLVYRIIEGETVILDRDGGVLHKLNPTASFIWDCCDGTLSTDDIIDRLVKAFEIDRETCRKDVIQALNQFRSLNLLSSTPFDQTKP